MNAASHFACAEPEANDVEIKKLQTCVTEDPQARRPTAGSTAPWLVLDSQAPWGISASRPLEWFCKGSWLALAAVAGGGIGSQLGSRWLPATVIVRILGVTLVIAGLRLLWG